ncbi:hypothetical protein [Snodgrassella sp. B3837]|uniref:hypothetical protein n=1 Tax=Snodgrassella sp. B3837 TaxID=2818040 RepID=UPI00226AC143|nr:hypothetical protein [Snodgrassella sp. B3837]MCX8753429.1 hypothetical protein [Snodgrassella sp. B3837]
MFAASDFTDDDGLTTDAYVVGYFDAAGMVVGDFGFAGAAVVAAHGRLAVDVDFAGAFGQIFICTGQMRMFAAKYFVIISGFCSGIR